MILNGKEYRNAPLDFNAVCRLEEMGVNLNRMGDCPMTTARAYAALCMRKPLSMAGAEIEAHIIGGGSIHAILEAFSQEVEKSGFFQALAAKEEAETTEPQEERLTDEA